MIDRVKGWLKDWPTTPSRNVVALSLCVGTAIFYGICVLRHIDIQEGAWDSWLIFLAALSGIDAGAWIAKRKTEWKPEVTSSLTTTSSTNPAGTVAQTKVVEVETIAKPADADTSLAGGA